MPAEIMQKNKIKGTKLLVKRGKQRKNEFRTPKIKTNTHKAKIIYEKGHRRNEKYREKEKMLSE